MRLQGRVRSRRGSNALHWRGLIESTLGRQADEKPMLRSMRVLEGYTIRATDGDIGHVKDYYFENDRWVVRYSRDDGHLDFIVR